MDLTAHKEYHASLIAVTVGAAKLDAIARDAGVTGITYLLAEAWIWGSGRHADEAEHAIP
jgi:hypothetical protein